VRIDVAFTPAEVRGPLGERVVVVMDVLRATSTIIHALVNGARSVLPVVSVEDAARTAERLGRDAVLLCGERDTNPIKGFHLGNSPHEFTPEAVGGKTLVMTTTNGTTALLAGANGAQCLVGALLNLGAIARRLEAERQDVLLLCAGREGSFALEDALCAGRIARTLQKAAPRTRINDATAAAMRLAQRATPRLVLGRSAAGQRLRELGREEDIVFCAQEDRYDVVPVLNEHRITL
jgi:2-phosphosulfolactate phosphatase